MADQRMGMIFDENECKYKCLCGCMSVRTGTAIIAIMKTFGIIVAMLELFAAPVPNLAYDQYGPTTPIPYEDAVGVIATTSSSVVKSDLVFVRYASTIIYLLVEAVAVSCLFYAIRMERARFVLPEIVLIVIYMSMQFVAGLLVIVTATFGSESLVAVVVDRLREQGRQVSSLDVDEFRHTIPYLMMALAFALFVGAAIEFWFFTILKSFYNYLRDKLAFRTNQQAQCYVNACEPMLEEAIGQGHKETIGQKDTPPAYQEIVKEEEKHPPSYTDAIQHVNQ